MTEETIPEKTRRLAEDIEEQDMRYHSNMDYVMVADAAVRINDDIRQLNDLGFSAVNRVVNGVPTYKVDIVSVSEARSGRAGPYVRRRPRFRDKVKLSEDAMEDE